MSEQSHTSDELKKKFGSLIRELGEAKLHFLIYKRLCESLKDGGFHEAWEFWNYTITAHAHSALIHLCRVYDDCRWEDKHPDWNPFHLLRLVKEAEGICQNKLKSVELDQLKSDLEFLQKRDKRKNIYPNPNVGKLREWRNKVICHRSLDLVSGGKDEFFKTNGFLDMEIQELIDKGFSILGRWSHCYESDYALWLHLIDDSISKDAVGVLPVCESYLQKLHPHAK
jgi:hypothetical protein